MDKVEHEGVIKEKDHYRYKIAFTSYSACADCHAKGACTISDKKDKIVEIEAPQGNYHVGDRVNVVLEKNQGLKAVFYGYFLPFLIFLCCLFITTSLWQSEVTAGLLSLAILVPYYFILYLSRSKVDKKFTLTMYKLNK
jgi:sigma-E factor negative regulatory protein RseC